MKFKEIKEDLSALSDRLFPGVKYLGYKESWHSELGFDEPYYPPYDSDLSKQYVTRDQFPELTWTDTFNGETRLGYFNPRDPEGKDLKYFDTNGNLTANFAKPKDNIGSHIN